MAKKVKEMDMKKVGLCFISSLLDQVDINRLNIDMLHKRIEKLEKDFKAFLEKGYNPMSVKLQMRIEKLEKKVK